MNEEIEYINSKTMCICCFNKPERQESTILVNGKPRLILVDLQKHHIRYFPEVIAYVHDHCHTDIHDGKYPFLIQYEEGDSRKFYEEKGIK